MDYPSGREVTGGWGGHKLEIFQCSVGIFKVTRGSSGVNQRSFWARSRTRFSSFLTFVGSIQDRSGSTLGASWATFGQFPWSKTPPIKKTFFNHLPKILLLTVFNHYTPTPPPHPRPPTPCTRARNTHDLRT